MQFTVTEPKGQYLLVVQSWEIGGFPFYKERSSQSGGNKPDAEVKVARCLQWRETEKEISTWEENGSDKVFPIS